MHTKISIVAVLLASSAAGTAAAHHSQAHFNLDPEAIETIQGTVTRFDFRNPHVYVYLETVEADGSTAEWELEATSTPNLIRRGWARDTLTPGERVTLDIHPAHDADLHIGRVGSVHFPDGRSLSATSGGPAAPANLSTTTLAGRWWGRGPIFQMQLDRTNLTYELTPKGQTAADAFDGSQNPQTRCIPMTVPTIMLYTSIFDVTLTEERMDISGEWLKMERTIYLDGRDHPPASERFLQGHSVGHWEGDTLVIDTTNYEDHAAGLTFEIPSGAQKHSIERMTLSDDGKRMEYSWTIEDPEYMAAPVSGTGSWAYRPDLERQEIACDPEVAIRFMERQNAQE